MLGEVNPFRGKANEPRPSLFFFSVYYLSEIIISSFRDTGTAWRGQSMCYCQIYHAVLTDSHPKVESTMCYLRGVIMLRMGRAKDAQESLMEALAIDYKNFDAFEALIGGEMMTIDEGKGDCGCRLCLLTQNSSLQNGSSFKDFSITMMTRTRPNLCDQSTRFD